MNTYLAQKLSFFLLAAALLAAFVLPAEAAFNTEINYQGKLTAPSGIAVADGTYNMRFWLLTSPSIATTSAVWTESLTGSNKVQVANGLFSVMLGSTTPLTSVDFNQPLYLGVEIGGTSTPAWDGEMSPRKILGAVPAAFEAEHAQDTDTLGGVAPTSFVRSDQADAIAATTASTLLTITQSGTGDILNLFDGATEVFTVLDGGLVGIGTSTPSQELTVAGDLRLTGRIYDSLNSAGASGYVLKSTGTGNQWVATSTLGFLSQAEIDSCSELASIVGGATGTCGSLVLSASPTFTGTVQAAAATFSSTLTLSGSSANIALGSNYLSGDGGDEGVFVSSVGNVGIGTTTPAAKLEVAGTSFLGTGFHTTNSGIASIIGRLAPGADAVLGFNSVSYDWSIGIDNSRNGFAIANIVGTDPLGTNSLFVISNAGNVGIGTTSPSAKLDVEGDILVANNGEIYAEGTGDLYIGNTNQGIVTVGGDTLSSYVTSVFNHLVLRTTRPSDDIIFQASSTEAMRIDATNGNIGIGSTTPSRKLTVAGTTYLGATTTVAGHILPLTNDLYDLGSTALRFRDLYLGGETLHLGTSLTDEATFGYNTTSNILNIGTDGTTNGDIAFFTDDLYFDKSSGNVGVGTTTTAGNKLAIFNNGADASILLSTVSGANEKWTIGIDDSDGAKFKISSSSALGTNDRFVINGAGNIGIGNSSPVAKLSIARSSAPTSISIANEYLHLGGSYQTLDSYHLIGFGYTSPEDNPNAYIGFQERSTTGSGKGDLIFGTRSVTTDSVPTERMRIDSNGNIGIGTTTPSQALNIFRSGADAAIAFGTVSGANEKWTIGIDDSDGAKFKISSSTALGTNDRFVINGAGKVGIGTSTPTALLTLNAGTNDGLRLNNGTVNGVVFNTSDTSMTVGTVSNHPLSLFTNNTARLTILSGGSVGIGTLSPGSDLQIGDADTSDGATSQKSIVITGNAAGSVEGGELNLQTAADYDGTYNTYFIDAYEDDLRIGRQGSGDFTLNSAGNIGIGTGANAPAARLAIDTNSNWGSLSINFNGAATFAGGFNNTDTGATGQATLSFLRNGSSVGTITTTNVATAYNTSSDRRIKENIDTTKLSLSNLMQLKVRDYSFTADELQATTTGFIAQELYEVFPWAVSTNGDNGIDPLTGSSTPWSVDYGRITPLIVKSVQDLNLSLTEILTYGTTTASSSYAHLFEDERDTVWSRLVKLAQGFVDGVLTLTGVRVEYVRSDYLESQQLCLTDGEGSTCVDRAQLRALLNGSGTQSSPQTSEGSSEDAYADPNAEQDTEIEDDAEIADVETDDEGAGDTDFDLGDSATGTDDAVSVDTWESIATPALSGSEVSSTAVSP